MLFRTAFPADAEYRRRAARAVLARVPNSSRHFQICAPLCFAVGGLFWYAFGPLAGLVSAGGFFVLLCASHWWAIRLGLQTQLKAGDGHLCYTFDDERLTVDMGKASASTAYELFENWQPIADGFLLRKSRGVFVYLPKEAVSAELAAFLDGKINRR